MADRSLIEWTDASWNPWRGCDKVSPGCAHCYMFRDQARYGRDPGTVVRAADPTFMAPARSRKWQEQRLAIEVEERRRMRVFTCSWSDFFHPDADGWRDEAWALIAACPQYDWQILTKRPELIADRLPDDWGDGYEHVWLGVSIENRRFVHRAALLRQTPATVRFVSAEPLLGPLVFGKQLKWRCQKCQHGMFTNFRQCPVCGYTVYDPGPGFGKGRWADGHRGPELDLTDIDWLIVGGESGSSHRRIDEEWVRDLRDLCLAQRERYPSAAEVHAQPALAHARRSGQEALAISTAFFFKQWGGPRPTSGGRELDGRTWSEFPAGLPVGESVRP